VNDLFLRACHLRPVERTPVWFMRQAGRFFPEYRKLREEHEILEIARTPELAARVARLPVERLGVDAAILFADIMIPVAAMGVDLHIEPDRGPVIRSPIRTAADVRALRPLDPAADVPFIGETVKTLATELDVPVIGFAGAPFTVASYLIEGAPSRTYTRTKTLMFSEPDAWRDLMDRLAEATTAYLRFQVETGASAVQLFDSWAGALGAEDYEQHVMPWSRRIFAELADLRVPRIHFGVGTAHLLELMRAAAPDVVGVDWRVPLDEAWDRVGHDVAIQGNLDPAALLAPWDVVERKATEILRRAGGRAGHVFNLGHGVLPETDPESLARLVEFVHEITEQDGAR
jgi:uroporphyrinogen decarboxylase